MSQLEELVEKINNSLEDVSVSISDFQKPSHRFFRSLMSRILEEFYIDIPHLLTYNLHEHSSSVDSDMVPNLNFLAAIRYVFPFIRISLFDILSPTTRKCYDIFNAAIDFYIFCDNRLSLMNESVESYQMKKNHLLALQTEYRRSQERMLNVVSEKKNVEQLLIETNQKVTATKQELLTVTKLAVKKEKECNEKESLVMNMKQQRQLTEKKITETRKEIQELERNVVKNSDMIVYELDKKKEELDKLMSDRDEKFQKLQEIETEAQEFNKKKPLLLEINKLTQNLSSVGSIVEEHKNKLVELRKQKEENEDELRKSETANNLLKFDLEEASQEIKDTRNDIKQRTEAAQSEKNRLQRELQLVKEESKMQLAHISSELESINSKLKEQDLRIKDDVQRINEKYKRNHEIFKKD